MRGGGGEEREKEIVMDGYMLMNKKNKKKYRGSNLGFELKGEKKRKRKKGKKKEHTHTKKKGKKKKKKLHTVSHRQLGCKTRHSLSLYCVTEANRHSESLCGGRHGGFSLSPSLSLSIDNMSF